MRIPTDDLYALLGVPPTADEATIRRAYRSRMRQLHPDMYPEHERARAHEQAARLSAARDFLTDPIKRRAYDASRLRPPPPPLRRTAVWMPETVDFGMVRAGRRPGPRSVRLSFSDCSRISRARVITRSGFFWSAGPTELRDVTVADITISGQRVPNDALPATHYERLRVELDEVMVDVTLTVTIEAAPVMRVLWGTRYRRRLLSALVALTITVAAVVIGGQLTHHAAPPVLTGYCSTAKDGGQMLIFYPTTPGTTRPASKNDLWTVMTPSASDPYIAWWTPQFPYWERVNQDDGFTQDGQTYDRLQYVEVLPIWQDPWEPLSTVFQDHPNLTGGPAAEAAERQLFIRQWNSELRSPSCS